MPAEVSDWMPRTDLNPVNVARRVPQDLAMHPTTAFIETTTISRWFVEPEIPLPRPDFRRLYPTIQAGPTAPQFSEVSLVSKWFQEPEYFRPIKDFRVTYPSFAGPVSNVFPETVMTSKWFVNTEIPQQPKKIQWATAPLLSVLGTVFSETVTLDKWFVQPQVPQIPKTQRQTYPSISALWEFPLAPSTQINPDMWYVVPEYPQFPKTWHEMVQWLGRDDAQWAVPSGATFTDWSLERPLEQPKHREFTYPSNAEGPIIPLLGEFVFIDKWFTQQDLPQRKQAVLPASVLVSPVAAAFSEAVLIKWFQEPELPQPLRDFRRLYPTLFGPVGTVFTELTALDKWFTQTERPLPQPLRLQHSFPTLSWNTSTPAQVATILHLLLMMGVGE